MAAAKVMVLPNVAVSFKSTVRTPVTTPLALKSIAAFVEGRSVNAPVYVVPEAFSTPASKSAAVPKIVNAPEPVNVAAVALKILPPVSVFKLDAAFALTVNAVIALAAVNVGLVAAVVPAAGPFKFKVAAASTAPWLIPRVPV